MSHLRAQVKFLVIAAWLLSGLLVGCSNSEPTETALVSVIPTATLAPEASATSEAFTSPLGEATPVIVAPEPGSSPSPSGVPDPERTPVIIAQAEITPDREVITIQNITSEPQDIGGWTLFNLEGGPAFRFPEGRVLEPGETAQVYNAVSEAEVPEGAYFWTTEKVWPEIPANVLLLNHATRLMYWHVVYE